MNLFSFETDTEDEQTNRDSNSYGGNSTIGENIQDYFRMYFRELDAGDAYKGEPDATYFNNDGKTNKDGKPLNYDSLRVRLWDTRNEDVLDAYLNIPKVEDGKIPILRKGNRFFYPTWIFLTSFIKQAGSELPDGINVLKNVDLFEFIDTLNMAIKIEITAVKGKDRYNAPKVTGIDGFRGK